MVPTLVVALVSCYLQLETIIKQLIRRALELAYRVEVLPPRSMKIDGEMTARQRRAIAGRRLYDEMSGKIFATSETDTTLFQVLLHAKDVNAGHAAVVENVNREPMNYNKLVVASMALGRALDLVTRQGEAVGVLLPNVAGVVATFFPLQRIGRVPAMLNYTAGFANLKAACTAADVQTVITSRALSRRASSNR